jgi:hypothetical protein
VLVDSHWLAFPESCVRGAWAAEIAIDVAGPGKAHKKKPDDPEEEEPTYLCENHGDAEHKEQKIRHIAPL